jgi:arsenate reductase
MTPPNTFVLAYTRKTKMDNQPIAPEKSAAEPKTPPHYNVLFLCTGNSARSIMAEAILNQKARGRFTAYSAGSHPSGSPRPEAIAQLASAEIPTSGLRSKSWDEFAALGAPSIDFIFTVCDNAANEVCPIWPGHPMTAHWGIPDPAAVKGTPEEIERAFRDAFTILDRRINLLLALPLTALEQLAIQQEINRIGQA